MSQFIYCDCCESANVETAENITDESYYMCTICREYCSHLDINVKKNNFKKELVIDYSN
jgi:Pyruvate/2-oxoacid:ferredoxin oxidoreductase delta subunit